MVWNKYRQHKTANVTNTLKRANSSSRGKTGVLPRIWVSKLSLGTSQNLSLVGLSLNLIWAILLAGILIGCSSQDAPPRLNSPCLDLLPLRRRQQPPRFPRRHHLFKKAPPKLCR